MKKKSKKKKKKKKKSLNAQRLRTYTQPTQPSSCWSTASTRKTCPPLGQAPCFLLAFCFMYTGE